MSEGPTDCFSAERKKSTDKLYCQLINRTGETMKLNMTNGLESFVQDYIGTALEMATTEAREEWALNHPEVTERDDMKRFDFDTDDLDPDALSKMTADATVFWNRNGSYILAREEYNDRGEWNIVQRAASDFYLTRNGHGSGFWDKPNLWGPYSDKFANDSKWFGSTDLTLGEDGKVYC
jgi:hypothetical protein